MLSDNQSFRNRMIPLGSIRGDIVAASRVFRVLSRLFGSGVFGFCQSFAALAV